MEHHHLIVPSHHLSVSWGPGHLCNQPHQSLTIPPNLSPSPGNLTPFSPAILHLHISNTENNLFLYATYCFFSLTYQTLITIFGSPTFIYSRHGFYKYVLFSFFHLFLRKSVGKGTEKYFPLTLMLLDRYSMPYLYRGWGERLKVVIAVVEHWGDVREEEGTSLFYCINY